MTVCIALGGNPNSGKSTLFNELTGSKQHVANYPGITVERKEGTYQQGKENLMRVVDLPGTYSLTAYSLEEMVTRNFLIDEKPDVIVNVVDASNLERNLYLTIQILELGIPTCIALNMVDVAKNNGTIINIKKLSKILGVPVVSVIARTGFGKEELIKAVQDIITSEKKDATKISYGPDIEKAINEIETLVIENSFMTNKYPSRWLAIKYLENDQEILSEGNLVDSGISNNIESIYTKTHDHIDKTIGTYPEAMISDQRYGYITSILKQGIVRELYDKYRLNKSDLIDKVLINRLAGPIIMLLILTGLYHLTFTYSKAPIELCNSFFIWLSKVASGNITNDMIRSLIVSGFIGGIGGILSFVPLIMFMFLGIAVIEDSGYLARIAFMMDRVFQTFGLHGSSVMPYIISGGIAGGCAVPGVMATRSLKSSKERIATLLTLPFMSCGAKLPIITLLIAVFFNKRNTEIMLILTLISWLSALLVAKFLRMTIIRGLSTPFVMELPPYRFPTLKGLIIHTWERTWQYIKKAGTIILGISLILWFVMTFPRLNENQIKKYNNERMQILMTYGINDDKDHEKNLIDQKLALKQLDLDKSKKALLNSIAGRVGLKIEEITKWAGFDWRTNIALLGGFAAKEVILSTLGTAYSLEDMSNERNELTFTKHISDSSSGLTSLSAFSLIIFIMFYSPCSATVICIIRETSIKWGIFSVIFNTSLAFLLSVLIYQTGLLLGY